MEYKRGMGRSQMAQVQASNLRIAKFLSDGKPHQFSEIKRETKLSSPTLSKRLKELVKRGWVHKRVDTESGKYPYPVYYTATDIMIEGTVVAMELIEQTDLIKEAVINDKQPLLLLEALHWRNTEAMIMLLRAIKKDKSWPVQDMLFNWENFVLEPYRLLSSKIVEASAKVIDEIDIDQIQKNQVAKIKIASTELLEKWKNR